MSVFGVKVMRYPVNHSLNGLSSLCLLLELYPWTLPLQVMSMILKF